MPENDPNPNENPIQPLPKTSGSELSGNLKIFTTPLTNRGWPVWLVYLMSAIGLIYILNPTLGLLEFIPDNLPLIGNLDEGVAFLLVWYGVVEFFEGKKRTQ